MTQGPKLCAMLLQGIQKGVLESPFTRTMTTHAPELSVKISPHTGKSLAISLAYHYYCIWEWQCVGANPISCLMVQGQLIPLQLAAVGCCRKRAIPFLETQFWSSQVDHPGIHTHPHTPHTRTHTHSMKRTHTHKKQIMEPDLICRLRSMCVSTARGDGS